MKYINDWTKILPKKSKYSARDINKVMTYSLFHSHGTLNEKQAFTIVKETAKLYNAEVSKALSQDYEFYVKNKK